MVKLVALYRKPASPEEFDNHFHAIHLPLLRAYPGLRGFELTRVTGSPLGEARFGWMVEAVFDDRDAMNAALASPEGKAVARDLLRFAPDVLVFFGVTEG
jgi:uncharacterized protein (TIGR02118 family)